LQPAISANNLPEGRNQVLNVHQVSLIDFDPSVSDENVAPENISHVDNQLVWISNVINTTEIEDD